MLCFKCLLCEHVVIVVSNSEMDYLGQCGILCLKAALRSCGHFGQLLRERAFCQQHCYVKMWSLWSAYQREGYIGQYILLCFKSCSVKMWSLWSASQREGYLGQYVVLCFKSWSVKMWSLWSSSQREGYRGWYVLIC